MLLNPDDVQKFLDTIGWSRIFYTYSDATGVCEGFMHDVDRDCWAVSGTFLEGFLPWAVERGSLPATWFEDIPAEETTFAAIFIAAVDDIWQSRYAESVKTYRVANRMLARVPEALCGGCGPAWCSSFCSEYEECGLVQGAIAFYGAEMGRLLVGNTQHIEGEDEC